MRAGTALALITLLGVVTACEGNTPPAQTPARHVAPGASSVPEQPPLLIEYVVLHCKWVEKLVPTPQTDVKAWAEAPENADSASGSFRHILIKAPADAKDADVASQKKKAQSILDRIKKGEDFAKLAKQHTEDPGSKETGGEYPADKVKEFAPSVSDAFAALKPGELSSDLVRSKLGFHIVRKDRAGDEQLERAYRKAKAPAVTKKLGEEILSRLKGNAPSRAAIAEAVLAVLGEQATNDANRPTASVLDRERLKQVRLTAAAKAAIETFAQSAHPGDQLPSPAVDGDTVLVARALAPGGS